MFVNELTADVGMEKVPVAAPACTVTGDVTGAKLLFEEETVTFSPPVGALLVKYTVPVTLVPPVTVYWLRANQDNTIGYTVTDPCAELEL